MGGRLNPARLMIQIPDTHRIVKPDIYLKPAGNRDFFGGVLIEAYVLH